MPGTHVLTPFLVQKVPYDPISDFMPVAMLGAQPYMIVSNVKQPFATLPELIAYARAEPGKVAIGVSDSVTLVVANAFATAARIDLNHHRLQRRAVRRTTIFSATRSRSRWLRRCDAVREGGRLRALAVSTPTRLPFLPDIPTIAEAIPGSNFDVQTWYAIAGPANLPPAVVERLHADIARVVADPDMSKRLIDLGIVPPSDTKPEAALATMKSYQQRMGKLMQAAGRQARMKLSSLESA